MIRNYLLVTFRNLIKNRVFTIINIIGLGISLSICIVAFFNHMFNYEFDRGHENFDKIYRVNSFRDMQEREQEYGIVPSTLGLEIKNDIPGIERAARLNRAGFPVKRGDDLFPMQVSFVDPEFLDIFTFPLIYGDRISFADQANVFISETAAETLFGSEYPVGKTVSLLDGRNREYTYTVSAVFTDLPDNSSFRIDILSHFDNLLAMTGQKDADWRMWTNALFIMVEDRSLLTSITESMKTYLPVQNRAREDFKINRFTLVPLKDVGANSRTIWSSSLFPSLHPAALLAPPIMALFILLIACFNFANTSRSIFSKRLKEIGLRKTFGGLRKQLVTQFMIETFIICLLALIAGIALAEFLVPAYSNLWAYMTIKLTLTQYPFFWVFLLLLLLITGFLAGVYPAWYVSSFNPVNIIRGDFAVKGSGRLSMILLTFQFAISVMSLVMGIVFARNSQYQKTLDLGYDRDKLVIAQMPVENFTSLRNEMLSNPKVISAEGSQNHIGYGAYRRPIKDKEKPLEVDVMDIGPGYAQAMGIHLVEGRLFDRERSEADISNGSIIVNQKFVSDLGWDEGVGHSVTLYDTIRLNVIGVVKDFYTNGVWQAIEPAMLRLARTEQYNTLVVRGNNEDLPGILEFMSMKWKSLGINSVFNGRLQEDIMQEEKDINGSILKVNLFLAVIATLLSLTGMYNMVSLDILKRTKEMGIRKIQGAPVPLIMFISGRKFIIVLLVASVLGCAGGYYMSGLLLDSIWDYFVDISAGMLLLASGIMLIATLTTISLKITKAALRNPVDSLRYE